MLQWVFIKDSKNTHLSSAKELVTAHFLSVYVTSSQDEHLSSLESITFIMLFSFLTEHLKSTKSSQKNVSACGFSQSLCHRLSHPCIIYWLLVGFAQGVRKEVKEIAEISLLVAPGMKCLPQHYTIFTFSFLSVSLSSYQKLQFQFSSTWSLESQSLTR